MSQGTLVVPNGMVGIHQVVVEREGVCGIPEPLLDRSTPLYFSPDRPAGMTQLSPTVVRFWRLLCLLGGEFLGTNQHPRLQGFHRIRGGSAVVQTGEQAFRFDQITAYNRVMGGPEGAGQRVLSLGRHG
jgi:hypothetical protein